MISKDKFLNTIASIYSVITIVIFVIWLMESSLTTVQCLVAALAVLLFIMSAFRAISFLTKNSFDKENHGETSSANTGRVAAVCVVWAVIVNILLFFASFGKYPAECVPELSMILSQDLTAYEQIALSWYNDQNLNIFPIYPIIVNIFNFIGNFFTASVIVSTVCAVLSGIALYHLALLDGSKQYAMRSVRYMFILPSAFLLVMPVSDSLLLLFSILFIYFIRKKYYINAFTSGFCASLCGLSGVLLIVPALIELYISHKETIIPKVEHDEQSYTALESAVNITVEEISELYDITKSRVPFYQKSFFKALHILGIPIGFAVYIFINILYSGKMFYFMQAKPLEYFWAVPSYLVQKSIPGLICFFLILILMIFGANMIRSSIFLYSVLQFLLLSGTADMLSTPRQLCILFPLALIAARIADNRNKDILLSAVFMLGFAAYLFYFITQLTL